MRNLPKLHPMLGSTLVMVLLAGGLALALRFGWLPGGAISFEMELGAIENRGSELALPLRLALDNPSGRAQRLKPQDVCKIFRWFIIDEASAFIQSAPKQSCEGVMIERALRPWEEAEEKIILRLKARRFQRGQSYYLIVRFWGIEQRQKFTY